MSALALPRRGARGVLGAGLAWRRRCLSLVAQAVHELRGPLQSALLGLHGLDAGGACAGARVAAVDLELRRAALALEDLSAAARGRRAAESHADVEVGALLADACAGWMLLARDRGATLLLEPRRRPGARPRRPRCGSRRRARTSSRTRSSTAAARCACAHGCRPAAAARIEVTDGGRGLPAPISQLLAAARGRRERRGHGLALAAGVAARCGGRLTTAPSPRGARLVLELPLAVPEAAGPRGVLRRLGRPPSRRGRVALLRGRGPVAPAPARRAR